VFCKLIVSPPTDIITTTNDETVTPTRSNRQLQPNNIVQCNLHNDDNAPLIVENKHNSPDIIEENVTPETVPILQQTLTVIDQSNEVDKCANINDHTARSEESAVEDIIGMFIIHNSTQTSIPFENMSKRSSLAIDFLFTSFTDTLFCN
jgi:hypothetical protein